MSLPELCIRRPIFALMLNLLIVLFGVVGYLRLPVRELPDVDPPIVTITTVYRGASAEVIESEVTERIEQEVNTIPGIKTLTSISREEVSIITVRFELDRQVDVAAQDVRDRIARSRQLMPEDIEEPIIAKQDANAQEVLWLALYSDRYSTLELTEIGERQFKDRLQTLPGVGGVNFGGEKRQAIRVRLDAKRMAAREVTASDVTRLFRDNSIELPSGRLENYDREMSVRTLGKLNRPEQFENLIVRYQNGAPVRLSEIAKIEMGVEEERTIARYNQRPAVGLGIVKQSEANAVEVADAVKAEVERIRPFLPAGVEVTTAYDSSTFVRQSIKEVQETILIAFVLVLIIMLAFLRNFRSTLIPMIAVPISLIGTFMILYVLNYSISILTLLAMVLAVGVVVDDAIVVLENIYRHIEAGMEPMEAALKGVKEITTAVVAITITLVAVFLPIAFQSGTTGILFKEFAVATAGSVVISAFVALTLTPTLCARILKHEPESHGKVYLFLERIFKSWDRTYARTLGWAVRSKFLVVVLAILTLVGTYGLYTKLTKEFLPDDDKGYVFVIMFGPEGATSDYTDQFVKQAEKIAKEYPETVGMFSAVALARGAPGEPDFGIMFVQLKNGERRSAIEIARPGGMGSMFTRLISEIKGVQAITVLPKSTGFSAEQYQLVLQGGDLQQLEKVGNQVRAELAGAGFLAQPRLNLNFQQPQLAINIDRDLAANLGISVREASEALQLMWGGLDVSRYNQKGKEYKVIAQLEREGRLVPASLEDIYLRSSNGQLIPASSVVIEKQQGSPNAINRFGRQRAVTIAAQVQGMSLGEAVVKTEEILAKTLPPGVQYRWDGEADEIKSGTKESIQVLVLALLIVYMVLAAQFESLRHPFVIMLALPLALFGAFGGLYLLAMVNQFAVIKFYAPLEALPKPVAWLTTNLPEIPSMTLNVYSLIGIVLLLGLVTKNSILLVEFANQKMDEGMDAVNAMLEAGRTRLRPILMTAFSTVIGILPVALGLGEASVSRRPLGVAVVAGMITSTFLTLYIVPVVYILIAPKKKKVTTQAPAHTPAAPSATPEATA
ncbi:MAG: cation/multidrug efflux pump [Verrucomicrobia bacterium]|jgi:hydrophobe/amphiphile efflux-1 (HAE1) family protein|nr:cation/multidrug efflux pump [Verrucomicrobiota bacterium]